MKKDLVNYLQFLAKNLEIKELATVININDKTSVNEKTKRMKIKFQIKLRIFLRI